MALLDSNDQVVVMSSLGDDRWEVSTVSPSSIFVCYFVLQLMQRRPTKYDGYKT